MGVKLKTGVVVSLTNFRDAKPLAENATSRGKLVQHLLNGTAGIPMQVASDIVVALPYVLTAQGA